MGSTFHNKIKPMLCTLVKEVPVSSKYIFEMKWDGFRILSYVEGKNVRMDSRGGLDYTRKYPLIIEALLSLKHDCILDGEVVVFKDGKPDFNAVQLYDGKRTAINYCVFDILYLDGNNLMHLPLTQRKELLKTLIKGNQVLIFSESYDNGKELYQQSLDQDLEGIVAKDKSSHYLPDNRGSSWLKIPTRKRQEFVIGGWAESDKVRSFRSLLFGAYENDKFMWIGRSGGGYKHSEMPGILKKLQDLEIDKSPFSNKILDTKGSKIHYVKPVLVANFEFAAWTESGRIRKPATFLGFRDDKKPEDVVREVPKEVTPKHIEDFNEQFKPISKKPSAVYLNEDSNWKELDKQKITSTGSINIEDVEVNLHNIEKELWPEVKKADLIRYYIQVGLYMLPHLRNRPLTLYVKHLSPQAPGLYIKDMESRQPEFADIFSTPRKIKKAGKRNIIDYLVCNNLATLIYLIDLGCIDVNPWCSRVQNYQFPDFINVDLDPSDNDFNKAVVTAQAAKEVFDRYKLKAFPKTSGKTGIHLFIPCQGFTFPQARTLSENLGKEIHTLLPEITTTEVSIKKRGTKLFIDPSQNDEADTLACVYSVRPYKYPTVSTPLEWKEIKPGLESTDFTINTVINRIEKEGDLFLGLYDKKILEKNTEILSKYLQGR